jgi:N,N'-diacetyllegionaminate synthase
MAVNNFAPHTVVIAEIGVNHNGDVATARRLVRAARDAGANYAKFQTFSADQLASRNAPLAEYQKTGAGEMPQVQMLRQLELSQGHFAELQDFCRATGIGFLTTAHDFVSYEFVLGLKPDYIKIASGDLTNRPFLERVARSATPVILSTGMADFEEIEAALFVLGQSGLDRELVTVLQCTTNYPAPVEEANLLAMVSMGRKLKVKFGYSDHTEGTAASIAAVALGATVIEKHLTLDRSMLGPDHSASSNPEEFAQMVSSIRLVELALGSAEKTPTRSEVKNRNVVRKSIVALRAIAKGEVFSPENIGVKRPGTGLSPMDWYEIVGLSAHRDFFPDEMIELP